MHRRGRDDRNAKTGRDAVRQCGDAPEIRTQSDVEMPGLERRFDQCAVGATVVAHE